MSFNPDQVKAAMLVDHLPPSFVRHVLALAEKSEGIQDMLQCWLEAPTEDDKFDAVRCLYEAIGDRDRIGNRRTKSFHDLVQRILPVLRAWDPEGLHRLGCPDDEYEHEAEHIAGASYRIYSVEDAAEVVCGVFNNSFGVLFGLKPGQKPGRREGYRMEDPKTATAVGAVLQAVEEHRVWLHDTVKTRRAMSRAGTRTREESEALLVKLRGQIDFEESGEGEDEDPEADAELNVELALGETLADLRTLIREGKLPENACLEVYADGSGDIVSTSRLSDGVWRRTDWATLLEGSIASSNDALGAFDTVFHKDCTCGGHSHAEERTPVAKFVDLLFDERKKGLNTTGPRVEYKTLTSAVLSLPNVTIKWEEAHGFRVLPDDPTLEREAPPATHDLQLAIERLRALVGMRPPGVAEGEDAEPE